MESATGRIRRSALLVLAVVIDVAVVGSLSTAHAQRRANPTATPEPATRPRVPNVRNMPLEQALQILERNGLQGAVQSPFDEAPLVVIRQFPASGAEIPRNRVVRLWVAPAPVAREPRRPSVSPSEEVVPDVRERPLDWALERLAEFDLEGLEAGRDHSTLAADLVIRQDPAPGAPLARARPVVRLWLSLGPRTVPIVRGLPLDEALARLEEEGLPGEIVGEAASDLPRGFVVDQEPEGGDPVVDLELIVRLWLSTGPPPERAESPRPLTVPDVRKLPLSRAVEILRDAGFGEEVVRRQISQLPFDFVIEQVPPGGARVEETDRLVGLVLSAGSPEHTGFSPWVIGGAAGLLVGLGLGALWQLRRRRPGRKIAGSGPVHVIPRADPGEQLIETTDSLDMDLEIELQAVPDPGEPEIESDGPLFRG